ncbi:TIGR03564 family F420-dependent LLM class oxidoreductase [Pseudonocardia sp. MH-G8]|uniref:TIGR03564 family F420-dependent LLM class oxidoreductase n=1 Tax=Pseudonocardia sp. MH-G8 TaxID=1854588 RepID=UPI0018EA0C3A|nr:TIGR03564 family F420-dependent LLM class oxidoreductase [Pseudonocardia sp. MH-G8]
MRISVLTFLGNRDPVNGYVERLRQVRDEGFTRAWTSQLPQDPDLLTTLAVALREVEGIEVGTGVLPIQVQHPMALAQRALTVNLISGGRLLLGLGLSHQIVVENVWGMSWERPVRRMREFLDGLLPLLAGDAADATGEFTSTRGRLVIHDAPTPPVYIAALGPQMLRLAGRRTAGTMTWMTGPRTLAEHTGPGLREAADGRPVEVIAALPICVTDDAAAARAQAAENFETYGKLPSYRAMLDREGWAGPEDAALIGTESEVAGRVEEMRAAGVAEFVGSPFGPSELQARSRALLLSCRP